MKAYEACLSATSSTHAAWHVVSTADKRNARLIISEILLTVFEVSEWPSHNPPRSADEDCI